MLRGVSRICLDCGARYKPGHPTYCPNCARGRGTKPKGQERSWSERQRRKKLVLEHLRAVGPWCEGYGVDPHWVQPGELTADHVIPRVDGGEGGPLRVLCRSCNSRRQNNPIL